MWAFNQVLPRVRRCWLSWRSLHPSEIPNCRIRHYNFLTIRSSLERLRWLVPPDHLLLDSAPNFGPLLFRWKINKFKNCWYKSVRIFEVLKLLFQQFLNLSSFQRDMSGPILGDLSNDRWLGVSQNTKQTPFLFLLILLIGNHQSGLWCVHQSILDEGRQPLDEKWNRFLA